MPLVASIRRRLTPTPRLARPGVTPPYELPFDPQEAVPSYENSQMLHERQGLALGPSRHNSSIEMLPHSVSMVNMQSHSSQLLSSHHSSSMTNMSQFNDVTPPRESPRERHSIKQVGLNLLNARQHFALAFSRDVSLIPPLVGLVQLWRRIFIDDRSNVYNLSLHNQMGTTLDSLDAETRKQFIGALTGARLPEHFLTGLWCIVAGYLSYSVLDGLIIRWIVTYLTSAAIVRVLSMSAMIITIEQYLVSTFSADGHKYGLHIWILICCLLTCTYIVQNFVTSNLDLKKGEKRARFFDFYNIVVFAVVPVGFTSFVSMILLLRSLLIVRIDIDQTLRTA